MTGKSPIKSCVVCNAKLVLPRVVCPVCQSVDPEGIQRRNRRQDALLVIITLAVMVILAVLLYQDYINPLRWFSGL